MESGLELFPEQASRIANNVDLLYLYLVVLTAFFTLLVGGLVIYFAVKYRRTDANRVGEQIVGSTKLEISWMLALLPLAMIAFVWGAKVYADMGQPPPDAIEIHVLGKQWMWKFVHEDGQQEINELHVPVGLNVKLTMISQDIIHDLYIPAFRLKWDVLPGRYTTLWFEATDVGEYHLFCAEYCGTYHSRMIGRVVVMEPSDYQLWLAGDQDVDASPVEVGAALFQQAGCAGCHRPDGTGPGPSLVGIFGEEVELESGETVVVDADYIHESLVDPLEKIHEGYEPIMPTYEGQLGEEEIFSLIAYIESLSDDEAE